MNLADYCGRCYHWIWGRGCKCGRFVNGKNVEEHKHRGDAGVNDQLARLMEKHVALELRLEHWRATGHALIDAVLEASLRGDYKEAERLMAILAPNTGSEIDS